MQKVVVLTVYADSYPLLGKYSPVVIDLIISLTVYVIFGAFYIGV